MGKIGYMTCSAVTLVCASMFYSFTTGLDPVNNPVVAAEATQASFWDGAIYIPPRDRKTQQKSSNEPEKSKEELCAKDKTCELLAKAVLYESRGEGEDGQKFVASVILNRVGDSRFPDTIEDVIYQKSQFSFIRDMHKQKKPTMEAVVKARKIAYDVLNKGVVNDKILWYHSTSVKPSWARKAKGMKKGNHIFYGSL